MGVFWKRCENVIEFSHFCSANIAIFPLKNCFHLCLHPSAWIPYREGRKSKPSRERLHTSHIKSPKWRAIPLSTEKLLFVSVNFTCKERKLFSTFKKFLSKQLTGTILLKGQKICLGFLWLKSFITVSVDR